MLDTGFGNIIKENFVLKSKTVNYNNILKLSGINEYSLHSWRNHFIFWGKEVTFHIVSKDFPTFYNPTYRVTIFLNRLPQR